MAQTPKRPLFVLGTGTDVGKTYVTGLILKALQQHKLSAGYYKAAMSGNARDVDDLVVPGDALAVKQAAKLDQPLTSMYSYAYEPPVSPHLAAQITGSDAISLECIERAFSAVRERYEYVVVEGAGGVVCPLRYDVIDVDIGDKGDNESSNGNHNINVINSHHSNARSLFQLDLVQAFDANCVLVVDASLGAINAAALSTFYLQQHGVTLKGIILNRYQADCTLHIDNYKICQAITGVPVIACVQNGAEALMFDDLSILLEQLFT